MEIFCISDFKEAVEKLIKKKSYFSLEIEIIDHFFNKPVEGLRSGTRLNNSPDQPYIKKRLEGSGGYRVYYLLLIKEEKVFLMFVHPKTGAYGSSNITDESKNLIYKKVYEAIKTNDLYKLENINGKIDFKKL